MTDLSKYEPIDRWERSAHPERRCTAHRKNGDRCKNAARLGTNVCDFHGAKAPQVKRKARQRIEEAADRMACELLRMATDDNIADSVKLAAIRDALDRAGLAAKSAVEVEVGPPKPWEQIMETIEAGSPPSTAEASADPTTPTPSTGRRWQDPASCSPPTITWLTTSWSTMMNLVWLTIKLLKQNRLWAPIGMNRNETRDDHDGWERGTG